MATLISELRTYLLADAAIAAVVVTRVRPRKLEQAETLPAVRLNVISSTEDQGLDGSLRIEHATVQVDAYALTSEAADSLATLLRSRLIGYRGTLASTIKVSGIEIAAGLHQQSEPPADASDQWRYVSSRDYRISYQVAS